MAGALDLAFLQGPAARRRLALALLAGALAGGAYGLLAPRWFRTAVTVVPARQARSAVASALGAELGGLAAGIEPGLGGGTDAARIAAVLQSVAVSDAAVERFGLRARYGEASPEGAREALWRHCDVAVLPRPNLVQLACEDRDPRLLQELLAFLADHGNQVFRRVGVSSAAEEVRFLEKRTAELRRQADEASARMRAFQERNHIVDLESQAKAVVAALASLHGQSVSKQLEVEYARRYAARDEASMRQLESQLSVVDGKLRDLQEVPAGAAAPEGAAAPSRPGAAGRAVFPSALAVPALRAELEALLRERKVAETTLVYALERLEAARATEAREASTFQVLDPPALATRPVRPRPVQALAGGALLGLIGGAALSWWRVRRHTAGLPGVTPIVPARRPGA